jgi:hypothetical protein
MTKDSLDAHSSADKEPHFCRRNIVVDELLDHNHVAPDIRQAGRQVKENSPVVIEYIVREQESPYIRPCSLDNQATESAQNNV